MGAPNNDVMPELNNVHESPFYLATRKEGAAILDKKLHRNCVILKDVTFVASCQVGGSFEGGKATRATDSGKQEGKVNLCRVMIDPRRLAKLLSASESTCPERTMTNGMCWRCYTHRELRCAYVERAMMSGT
jgi:hypothetical protein